MQFPPDYRPAFDDEGGLVSDMVQAELDRCTPGGWAGTYRVEDAESRIAPGEAVVMIHVMPGVVIDEVFRHTPVNLVVSSQSYATSVKVMRFLEDELTRKFKDGVTAVDRSDGSRTRVAGFSIDETQQQIVFENPDHRAFESTFRVKTKKRTP